MCTFHLFTLCIDKVTLKRYSYHLVEKADKNGADSPMAGSNGRQEDQIKNEESRRQSSVRHSLGEYKPKVTLAGHQDPTYYLGGGNGNAM